MAKFKIGDPQCKNLSPDVRSHALRVNRGTCVNQNSSLLIVIASVDALFQSFVIIRRVAANEDTVNTWRQ